MKKLITIIITVSIALSSVSSINVFAKQSDISYIERPTVVETDKINAAVKIFSEDLKKPDNREKVFEDYNVLLDLAARNGDIHNIDYMELEKLNCGMKTNYEREYLEKNYTDALVKQLLHRNFLLLTKTVLFLMAIGRGVSIRFRLMIRDCGTVIKQCHLHCLHI